MRHRAQDQHSLTWIKVHHEGQPEHRQRACAELESKTIPAQLAACISEPGVIVAWAQA
jgi:hypothetical protein